MVDTEALMSQFEIGKGCSVEQFANARKRGLLLVVFAQKEEDVPKRVQMAQETVLQAEGLMLLGKPFFSRIDIVITSADTRYVDRDCGKTKQALLDALKSHRTVFVHEDRGDAFSGIKNFGFALQSRHGIDYTMTLSPEARSYLTQETIDAVTQAVCDGAIVVGVATGELTQSILEGRVAGTCALWNTMAMLSVGGFDMAAAGKTIDDREVSYVKGWNTEKGEVFYALAGVEEMVPLACLVDKFGPCIAPVYPAGEGVKRYQAPDPMKEPELYKRHCSKMGTKYERQSAHLYRVKRDVSHLKGGVMEKYRTWATAPAQGSTVPQS